MRSRADGAAPVGLVWGHGFYRREYTDGARWRWAARGGAAACTPEPLDATLELGSRCSWPGTCRVSGAGVIEPIELAPETHRA